MLPPVCLPLLCMASGAPPALSRAEVPGCKGIVQQMTHIEFPHNRLRSDGTLWNRAVRQSNRFVRDVVRERRFLDFKLPLGAPLCPPNGSFACLMPRLLTLPCSLFIPHFSSSLLPASCLKAMDGCLPNPHSPWIVRKRTRPRGCNPHTRSWDVSLPLLSGTFCPIDDSYIWPPLLVGASGQSLQVLCMSFDAARRAPWSAGGFGSTQRQLQTVDIACYQPCDARRRAFLHGQVLWAGQSLCGPSHILFSD
jgi:hypothetical protein|mmetsp:Transcript_38732/g.64356  ORF Transcript_38732/g.64356 Transcript_38732/m.64356 type:complete len:251 (-) Transcript_38732:1186-1938(-)